MDLAHRPRAQTAVIAAAVALLVAVAVIPAALLVAGAIGVWTAVALYVGAAAIATLGSEAFQRLR